MIEATVENPDRTILVVDDEALVRLSLADLFQDEGWFVYEAEDAVGALAILEAHQGMRVVLTDVRMPGDMDGLKLAHHVRDRYPPTMVVVASGAMQPAADQLPEQATFVPKPFNRRILLDAVGGAI